ncbi:hypothetical protein [Enterococcus mundtii]|uniref:hypothetical protein n=1 Tax=Enterococcus mundtii TaxID=53346 RepID=UPI001159A822|nr:hypothetical protein [Enterococcus mundtii]
MEIETIIALVEQRFKETNLSELKLSNSKEFFAKFTNDDVPSIKMLNSFNDYRVITRSGENNLEKLIIRKV